MNLILLSGGSGKRLWPLSNDIRSKQFLKLFKEEGNHEGRLQAMVERMYSGIKSVSPDAKITIATGKAQVSAIKNHLGNLVNICCEPARKDTFPAICLAAAYQKDCLNLSEDEIIIVVPVDPFVKKDYFETLKIMEEAAKSGDSNLYLMGISPTYPSEKYGYILNDENKRVTAFKEKPDLKTAERYLEEGAFWNGGVFAFKLGYVLKKAHELIDFTNYEDLFSKYESLEKISFDIAVSEKEKEISMIPFYGEWKDLGTWNTLTEAMDLSVIGKGILADSCENTHIVNELDIPVLAMGLKDVVIAASPDGILVSDKHESSYMKPYVDRMDTTARFAEKSWGSMKIIDVGKNSLTIKEDLSKGHEMNYHYHNLRDEIWTILEGSGLALIDDEEIKVSPGSVINIKKGVKHKIKALTDLKIMEIQLGEEILPEDKIKIQP